MTDADTRISRAAANVQRVADAKEKKLLDEIVELHRKNISLIEENTNLKREVRELRRRVRMTKIIQKEAER